MITEAMADRWVWIDLSCLISGVIDLLGTCWTSFHATSWVLVVGSWQKLA